MANILPTDCTGNKSLKRFHFKKNPLLLFDNRGLIKRIKKIS